MAKKTKNAPEYLQELGDLIEQNKEPRNQHVAKRVYLARVLLKDQDMPVAWREIAKAEIKPLAMLNYVHQAHDDAIKESQRPLRKEEGVMLDAVRKDLKLLRRSIEVAIEGGALPANTGWPLELHHADMPALLLSVGFGGMNKNADWIGYPLDLTETIEAALTILESYRHGLPDRAIERQRGERNPAFVRLLVLKLQALHGKTLPATVAAIANAIDAPPNPWDGPSVVSAAKVLPKPVTHSTTGSKGKRNPG